MKFEDAITAFGVSELVARAYEALEIISDQDADHGNVTVWFLDGFLGPAELFESYVRGNPGHVSWENTFDIDVTPDEALDWFAQFVGTRLSDALTAANKRQAIQTHPRWFRGKPAPMLAALRDLLTGTKRVTIVERWNGHGYQLALWTYAAEVANPAAVYQAIADHKPGGLVLMGLGVSPGLTWYDASHQYATWGAMAAAQASWATASTTVPTY